MLRTPISRLRLLAYLEGISFILLIGVGMPLKYFHAQPMPNFVIGMLHGILFIAYCLQVLAVKQKYEWNLKITFLALLASLIPFGTFVADVRIFKPAQLDIQE